MENVINTLHLSGKVVGTPVVGHEAFGEKFYYLTLGVPRLSGAQDLLPVTLSERLLDGAMLSDGDTLAIDGQVRSYNKIIEGAGRLLITAFAQKIVENDEHENPNQIQLTGTLCKAPAYRTTPFGREIADMMLAVNGIPLVAIELKDQLTGQTIDNAIAQLMAAQGRIVTFYTGLCVVNAATVESLLTLQRTCIEWP